MEPLNFMPPFSCTSICSGLHVQGLGTQATLHASCVCLLVLVLKPLTAAGDSLVFPQLSKKILWLLEVTRDGRKVMDQWLPLVVSSRWSTPLFKVHSTVIFAPGQLGTLHPAYLLFALLYAGLHDLAQ